MKLYWSVDLSISVVWIDDQHRKLFDKINVLIDSLESEKEGLDVDTAFELLEENIHRHFNTESKYMIQYKYPQQKQHLIQHIAYEIEFNELKKKYKNEGVSAELTEQVKLSIAGWWKNHIIHYDKVFGEYLKSRDYLKKNIKPVETYREETINYYAE